MKKTIIICVFVLLSSILKAQGNEISTENEETSKADTTRLKFGNVNIVVYTSDDKKETKDTVKEVKEKKHRINNIWKGLDIGIAGFLTPERSLDMDAENLLYELNYARSRTIGINFSEKKIPIFRNHMGLVTGLGISFNRYHFNNRYAVLTPFTDSLQIDESGEFSRKHFLSATFLNVPLLLEFNTHKSPHKSFQFAAGIIGGYRIGSRSVRVTEEDRSRLVIRDDFNLAPFNLSATVRFGYGQFFNIFATYSLTEMFKNDRGPELNTFTAGITLFN